MATKEQKTTKGKSGDGGKKDRLRITLALNGTQITTRGGA